MTEETVTEAKSETKPNSSNDGELISLRELLEAGVHLGHNAKRWNPKMAPYIFGTRNKVHIIDLRITQKLLTKACQTVTNIVARGGDVLFVGTKRQISEVIKEEAERCKMHYITHRWLGGTLTNFHTITNTVSRVKQIETMREDGTYDALVKKERLKVDKEYDKKMTFVGGIKQMAKTPAAIFVVDPNKEVNAVREANRLGLPVIALIDTNGDPDNIDLPIPGNDDSIRTTKVVAAKIADAVLAGAARRKETSKGGYSQPNEGNAPKVEVARRPRATAKDAE